MRRVAPRTHLAMLDEGALARDLVGADEALRLELLAVLSPDSWSTSVDVV